MTTRFVPLAALALAVAAATPAHAVHKCIDAAGRVSYQDAPCPGAGTTVGQQVAKREQAAAEEKRRAAERKAVEEILAREREREQAKIKAYAADEEAFRHALYSIRAGMTRSQVAALDWRLLTRGEARYMESVRGKSEWRTFENGTTIYIQNDIVVSVHSRY